MSHVVIIGAHSTLAKDLLSRYGAQHRFHLISRTPLDLDESSVDGTYVADPVDLTSLESAFGRIVRSHTVDAVINFCGSVLLKPAHLITPSQWRHTLDVNLTTAFHAVHLTAKLIQRDCQIILFSSAAAGVGLPNHEAIAAAKAGVEGLARSAAASYAAKNIRCNVVAPGMIETTLTRDLLRHDSARQLSEQRHPLGSIGQPSHISQVLHGLLTQTWMTGAVIPVDGGLTHVKTFR